jgi:hypothetical protein
MQLSRFVPNFLASYELRIAEWHFYYTNVKTQFHLYVCVVSKDNSSFS